MDELYLDMYMFTEDELDAEIERHTSPLREKLAHEKERGDLLDTKIASFRRQSIRDDETITNLQNQICNMEDNFSARVNKLTASEDLHVAMLSYVLNSGDLDTDSQTFKQLKAHLDAVYDL